MSESINIKGSNGHYAGIIALIAIGQVIFGTDFGAVNVALASIAKDLQIAPGMLSWVVGTYSLAYAGFLVLGGRASDSFGRRRFCILGLLLFGSGSLLAVFSFNVWTLIAARALEGFGSAFFIPSSFSLINVLLPEGQIRHRAFAVFSATQGIAMILGLCGGGIVTTTMGWRAVFLINIPLVVAAILLSYRFIPAHLRSPKKPTIDVAGAILITMSAVFAVAALSAIGEYGWTDVRGTGVLVASMVALAAFLILERNLKDPLVPPAIYHFANFFGANLASVGIMATTGGLFVLLNLFMQRALHFSAMESGLGMLPYASAVIVAGRLIGYGMSRYPIRKTILAGFVVFIAATLLFAAVSTERGYGLNLAPAMIVAGLGSTVGTVLLMALSTSAVPAPIQGVATGVLVTFQQIGLALGVSVALTVVAASSRSGEPIITAFRLGFLATTCTAVMGLVCALLFTRKPLAGPGATPDNVKLPELI